MKLPDQNLNIYPKTSENINAVLSYYFDQYLLFEKAKAVDFLIILPESQWSYSRGSTARPKIKEFKKFVSETEADIEFLKRNN